LTMPYTLIELKSFGSVSVLALNRPQDANAFSQLMMLEIIDALENLSQNNTCRVLIVTGRGKHFSAGADLTWMKESAQLSWDANVSDASTLVKMFETLHNLNTPTLAVVRGAAFGGAVGLIAACDYAFIDASTKICLSEVKLGLIPAVIGPYLARKIPSTQLRRMALTGQVLKADQVVSFGLASEIFPADDLTPVMKEIGALLSASPCAQALIKTLLDDLRRDAWNQSDKTVQAIAKARTSAEGQSGLQSFFDKSAPAFVEQIPEGLESYLKQLANTSHPT
jgi:methylglutaconyl-CoA hydratase